MLKIIFMGTPEFAVPSLRMLVEEGYEVVAVVTQPDKPKGRGKKLAAPPVKEFAQQYNIQVLQPERIKTDAFIEEIRALSPDLLVTAAYGKIISKALLDVPRLGCINVHGSLLPKLRGAAPIQWSIINGDTVTGITTMFTDVGIDTGDMLLKREIEITPDMTGGELHDRLAELGAIVLSDTLKALVAGTLERIPQDDSQHTYAPMFTKEIGLIDWNKSAQDIHNLVRGTDPWPGAYTFIDGERMRVWRTKPVLEDKNGQIGEILSVNDDGLLIKCGVGCIKVLQLQFDSSKRMSVSDYLRGHTIEQGAVLK